MQKKNLFGLLGEDEAAEQLPAPANRAEKGPRAPKPGGTDAQGRTSGPGNTSANSSAGGARRTASSEGGSSSGGGAAFSG